MIQQPEIKLKQLRELKNYTQEYVATQLGLTTRAYSKIESGETQLTINRLNEISAILGIDPMDNNTIGTSNYSLPDKLIEQYEKRIHQLESEVMFLRALVK